MNVNIGAVVQDRLQRPTRYRWFVVGVIFVIYMVASADRANIGIALPHIRDEFEINNTQAGLLASLFFLAYALCQIPAGFLISRTSVRWMAPVFMILTSLSTGLIGTTTSLLQINIYRVLLGLSEAPLPLSMLATINRWFPQREKGTATGFFLAAVKMGAFVAPIVGAIIIATGGWRALFLAFAIPGIIMALVWWLLIADEPRKSRFANEEEAALIESDDEITTTQVQPAPRMSLGVWDKWLQFKPVTPIATSGKVFTSWNIWSCGFAYLLMTGIVNVLLAWLPTYLGDVKGFALIEIGIVASLPFVGGVLGNLFGGWLSDKVLDKRRKPTMIISAIATGLAMVGLVYAPNSLLAVSGLMLGTGFLLNIGYSSFSVYAMGLTTKKTYPVAASVVNTAGQAGGAIFPLVTGMILDAYDWTVVFVFMAVCSLSALFFIFMMVEPSGREVARDHV